MPLFFEILNDPVLIILNSRTFSIFILEVWWLRFQGQHSSLSKFCLFIRDSLSCLLELSNAHTSAHKAICKCLAIRLHAATQELLIDLGKELAFGLQINPSFQMEVLVAKEEEEDEDEWLEYFCPSVWINYNRIILKFIINLYW